MCDRCNAAESTRELHRFPGRSAADTTTEHVCDGCLTRIERVFADHLPEDDHYIQAFCLGMSDSIDTLYRAHCKARGTSELALLDDLGVAGV